MTDQVWGCPWHGRVEREQDGSYWLIKGGDRTPLAGKIADAAAYVLSRIWIDSGAPGTHMVRAHGHVMTPRTPEQIAADREKGHEWLGAAMLSGASHTLHGTAIGSNSWIYSNAHGVWLISISVASMPNLAGTPLALAVSARRFGVVAEAGADVAVGTVTAASGIDVDHGAGWLLTSNLRLQSIRSDGGQVIVEIGRSSRQPSFLRRSGACYYSIEIARDEAGAWTCALALLAPASEMYVEEIGGGEFGSEQIGLALVIDQSPDTDNPDRPWIYHGEFLRPGDPLPTELWAPIDWHTFEYTSGVIEQQRTVHCGYVFDESDVLHEVRSRVRIAHACAVPIPALSAAGVNTVTPGTTGGDPAVYEYGMTLSSECIGSVDSEIVAEILLDGAVVSSVAAQLTAARSVSYLRGLTGTGQLITDNVTSIDIPGDPFYVADAVDTDTDHGWWEYDAWPILSGLSLWALDNGQLSPWPGSARDVRCLARLPFGQYGHAIAGAQRLSNNVWAPVIIWGQPKSEVAWEQISTAGMVDVSVGLPPAAVGAPVCPSGAGTGAGSYSAGTWTPEPIEYDYLHAELVVGGGVF